MKRLLFLALLAAGSLPLASRLSPLAYASEAHVYQCPMHPWIKSDRPGKCTICGMDLVAATSLKSQDSDPSALSLPASSITAIGVATTVVSRQPLTRTVRVNGTIDDDDSRHRLLTARAEGRVEKLHVNVVGAVVQAGAPLYDLYSPELQTAQREFVQLAKAGELAASALPAARARLAQLGLAASQLDALLQSGEPALVTTVLAPDGGTVVEKTVYEGQWLKTGDKLFAIGDFSKMWFMFDAYEQDIPWLRVGQTVQVTTRAVPGEVIEAPIEFIDPNFNDASHTTKIRAVLPNPHFNADGDRHPLFHRVLAEARVLVESPAVLAAPRSAILDAGLGPVAYVDLGDGNYSQRKLRLGRRGDALVEVLEGLAENERVVTTGALLLDAQAQLARESSTGFQPAPSATEKNPARETMLPAAAPSPAPNSLNPLVSVAIDAADALASDDFARYQKLFPALAGLAPQFPSLPALTLGIDLKSARRSFEPWSTAVADLVKPSRTALGVKIFQCPMSPVLKKGRWVQRSQPLKNPFFGSTMPDCGEEIP